MPGVAEKYLRPETIRQVSGLDLKARFIVEGFFSGLHASPFQGFSVEFSEHRKYVPGDDIRMIDWNVYAKTQRYYIKKYRAETNMKCYLLVDASTSMGYSYDPATMTKMDYSISCAAALSYIMCHQQDPVGLLTFDTEIRNFVEARSRESQLFNILSVLARTPVGGTTDVGSSLVAIGNLIKKRSLVLLFSDLLSDPAKVLEGLRYLRYKGHDVIVFHVLDQAELRFPFKDATLFEDTETARRVHVDAELLREGYLKNLHVFLDRYEKGCHQARIDYAPMDTSVGFDRTLVTFLAKRAELR
ncbi:MAG TPA: DUF58 domain-containing protein [Planctomycetota bacterium]|jgi:uncharacterized protein (DUF58 family)|nr:DUF58 domain-containing protein [Planctomycetota bacterium]